MFGNVSMFPILYITDRATNELPTLPRSIRKFLALLQNLDLTVLAMSLTLLAGVILAQYYFGVPKSKIQNVERH